MEKIAAAMPDAIILREKDMSPAEYRILAERVMEICGKYNVKCILHTFAETAAELGAEYFHAPFPILREMSDDMKGRFTELGTSCHSVDDAENAAKSGGRMTLTQREEVLWESSSGLAALLMGLLSDNSLRI